MPILGWLKSGRALVMLERQGSSKVSFQVSNLAQYPFPERIFIEVNSVMLAKRGLQSVYVLKMPRTTQVRIRHGALDEIIDLGFGSKVRRCNWVRFVRVAQRHHHEDDEVDVDGDDEEPDFNMQCFTSVKTGQVVFEVVENIPAMSELVVRFATATSTMSPSSPPKPPDIFWSSQMLLQVTAHLMSDYPLDLSLSLIHSQSQDRPKSSSVSSLDSGLSSSCEDNTEMNNNNNNISNNNNDNNDSKQKGVLKDKLAFPPRLPHPPDRPSSTETTNSSLDSDTVTTNTVSNNAGGKNANVRGGNVKTKNNHSNRRTKKMLPCDFCGKCFDRPSLLNRHLRTHTGERPHVCEICEKAFSTSSSLNTHRRIHSGEKPHECGVCGKRFTASSNLYYHRMTHIKEKPHKCELCQKSFPTPGDLKSHMYIHNGSWPHRCPICDRGFSKVTNLKNHLFLHTGQKPHECSKCGKRFALGCNMKAHMKTHENSLAS